MSVICYVSYLMFSAGRTLEDVQPQWKILEEEILPDIRKYNANDSTAELCEYLLVKCDRCAIITLHGINNNSQGQF